MKPILLIIIAVSLMTGCGGPWTMSKTELQRWYREDLSQYSGAGKMGYIGSDQEFHYFIARPVDDFVHIRVPKYELRMKEEHARSELGNSRMYFYLVNPEQGFRKM
jgi:hypothetical protein